MRSLRDLNLNSLRVVESAARNGSFVRAAEEQMLTASAVSQRVKNLEDQLRFKIFNRRNNAIILTTEGDAFVAHVREALDTILNAGIEAKNLDRKNVLKVSALPTFIVRWLLPRLKSFEDEKPDIRLNLSNSYTPPNFIKEDFDLCIRYGNGDFPGFESKLLFHEELTPVCTPELLSQKLSKKAFEIQPEDLSHFALLHSDTCTMNWQYWLEQTGAQDVLRHASNTYFDSCMLSYEAASAGLGFAIANCSYMMEDIAKNKLIAPFCTNLKSGCGWYVVYPKKNATLPKVLSFEKWLIKKAYESKVRCDEIFQNRIL